MLWAVAVVAGTGHIRPMNAHFSQALAALFTLLLSGPAFSASSAWFETEGGDIRLIVSGSPTGDGYLLGALEINLKPGWKTYWKDPGGAGVPLQMTLTGSENISGHTVGYPAPRRFDDGYSVYAGYKGPVALALTFTLPDPDKPVTIDAEVFLGICDTICIPVQTRFQLTTAGETGSTPEGAIVGMAHAALPQTAGHGLQISKIRLDGDMLVATVEADDTGEPDLYVVNEGGWYFGTPQAAKAGNNGLEFRIPLIERPAVDSDEPAIMQYTLIAGGKTADGAVPLPD